jgi:tRNA(adenine34) deaminase
MWADLSLPWQVCLEEAWAAYCSGSIPIGAAVVDGNGKILSRGRNRIWDPSPPEGQVGQTELAHAELNTLLALGIDQGDRATWTLYTTTEPCPLCLGAFYMSGVRTLAYACRDPWAGSTNLLGTTPYLSRKRIRIIRPNDPFLEEVIVALFVDWEMRFYQSRPSVVRDGLQVILPHGVSLGAELNRSGEIYHMATSGWSASLMFDWLLQKLTE